MVIDSRYNNGYSYGNWVHGTLVDMGKYTVTILPDSSSSRITVDINNASVSGLVIGKPYWFDIKDSKLQSNPTTTTPSGYNGKYGYDKTITIKSFWSFSSRNSIDLTDSYGNEYYIDSNTDVSGYYKDFYELRDADRRFVEGLKADITLSSGGRISKINIYR